MAKPFKGKIALDIRDSEQDWDAFLPPKAPKDAPNVLVLAWDDVGYGTMEIFGGPVETPNMRRIAEAGALYSNFHTTALCSHSRSSLLTGRNATSNGMATIAEAGQGFPPISTRIPFENAMIPAVLAEHGYNTYALGKWHQRSVDIETLPPEGLAIYCQVCGWALARAHARSGDRIAIDAYLGKGDSFDETVAEFAEHYADQNELDYGALADAAKAGRLEAETDLV